MLLKDELDGEEYGPVRGIAGCCGVLPYAVCVGPLFGGAGLFLAVGFTYNTVDMHLLGLSFLVAGGLAALLAVVCWAVWFYQFYGHLRRNVLVNSLLLRALATIMLEGWCQLFGSVLVYMVRGGRMQFDLGSFGAGALILGPLGLLCLWFARFYRKCYYSSYSDL